MSVNIPTHVRNYAQVMDVTVLLLRNDPRPHPIHVIQALWRRGPPRWEARDGCAECNSVYSLLMWIWICYD